MPQRDRRTTRRAPYACALALAVATSACGAAATPRTTPEVAPPVVEAKDPNTPRIALKGEAVLLDGAPTGDVGAAVQAGRATKLEALFSSLKERKEAFAAAHPSEPFQGRCHIELDAQAADPVWRSVVITAFFAGFTTMTLETAGAKADIRASIPLPPERGGPTKPIMLTVRQGKVEVLWLAPGSGGRRLEAVRPAAAGADGSFDLGELSGGLQKECGAAGGPCFDVISLRTLAPLSFGELVALARVVKPMWGGSEPTPVFDFMRGTSLAGSGEAAGGPGMADSTGRVDPGDVKRVVKANFNKFVACYNEGLKRIPSLAGRVAVKFVIDPDGRVAEASSVTSDASTSGSGAPKGMVTTLADEKVVACVLEAYRGLTFPRPQGGRAVVIYPIELGTR